ncbi:segregation/condensation protein A [Streptomyces sp. NPDC058861]|uniref:segregation/condensation protein A n=1 Tax=Streptomyces sp. NPDC058861 TaxID=3346653 RepID=UPI00367EF790
MHHAPDSAPDGTSRPPRRALGRGGSAGPPREPEPGEPGPEAPEAPEKPVGAASGTVGAPEALAALAEAFAPPERAAAGAVRAGADEEGGERTGGEPVPVPGGTVRTCGGAEQASGGPVPVPGGAGRTRDGAGRTPDEPEQTPGGPDRAPDGPDRAPDGPDRAPDGPDRAPDGPDRIPDGPDRAPDAPDRAPGGSEQTPVGPGQPPGGADGRFTVRLSNFEGPFDLLLQLITRHKLDVTEVALSRVTDEFMAHLRALGPDGDLDQTTEFLVVAATLLDLKTARLLPVAEVEDEADLALLEARDLLFARLLQYRAYKRIAAIFEERWESEGRRHPRTVGLEPHHAELLPEVIISVGAEGFAKLAVRAMQPRAEPQVYVEHIHAPLVSVREQAAVVAALLRERGTAAFRELIEDAGDTLTVVARFLALLELYRERAVALDQETALGDLTVSWTGGDGEAAVTDEFDQEPGQETEARA